MLIDIVDFLIGFVLAAIIYAIVVLVIKKR